MDHDFWHQRWTEGRLGFHQQKVNSRLKKFWNMAASGPASLSGAKVLVPLCGKSLDMLWLAREGHRVVGIEISDTACRDFYVENKLQCTRKDDPPFVKFSGGDIELWCGDFFDLQPDDLDDIHAVYDRAALIALPEAMRANYVSHLAVLLQPNSRIFLISMDYDESKMQGPPFSVPENEVRGLFENKFSIDIIARASGPDIVGNLAARGLDTLDEKVYLLERLPIPSVQTV